MSVMKILRRAGKMPAVPGKPKNSSCSYTRAVRQDRCADRVSILKEQPLNIRPNDKDHRAALAEIEACWGAPARSEKGARLEALALLVESYEAKRWPVRDDLDPIDTL